MNGWTVRKLFIYRTLMSCFYSPQEPEADDLWDRRTQTRWAIALRPGT
jgi:hypothetical protein